MCVCMVAGRSPVPLGCRAAHRYDPTWDGYVGLEFPTAPGNFVLLFGIASAVSGVGCSGGGGCMFVCLGGWGCSLLTIVASARCRGCGGGGGGPCVSPAHHQDLRRGEG